MAERSLFKECRSQSLASSHINAVSAALAGKITMRGHLEANRLPRIDCCTGTKKSMLQLLSANSQSYPHYSLVDGSLS